MSPKRERFVIEYLLDGNATQAAIRAGYSAKTAYSQGQRLLKNVEVATRVREGQRKAQKRNEITVDDMVDEFNENRRLSIEKDQMAAANAASNSKAKVLGLIIDKVKDVTDLDHMDDDELAAERRRLAEEIAELTAARNPSGAGTEGPTKH